MAPNQSIHDDYLELVEDTDPPRDDEISPSAARSHSTRHSADLQRAQTPPTAARDAATLAVHETPEAVSLGLVRANSPTDLVLRATEAANALSDVIENKRLYSVISGKRYVRCEGWTTLAAMLGFLPREETVARRDDGTYEASVALVRITDGTVLTRASAECGMDEPTWKSRPNYARRSMAVTRATSKACRIALSWVMALTGYEVTPAEEVPHDGNRGRA